MKITIKEYIPYITKKEKRDNTKFLQGHLNWNWTLLSSNGKVITYGYTHTKENAINIAKNELRNRSKFTCNS